MNKIGVCFLILGFHEGRLVIYCVKENKAKPMIRKEGGEIGPPFETFEEADATISNTLRRLLQEETSLNPEHIYTRQISQEIFSLFPDQPHIKTMWAWATYHGNDYETVGTPQDQDVSIVGWRTLEQLKHEKQRVETPVILQAFRSINGIEKALYLLNRGA